MDVKEIVNNCPSQSKKRQMKVWRTALNSNRLSYFGIVMLGTTSLGILPIYYRTVDIEISGENRHTKA